MYTYMSEKITATPVNKGHKQVFTLECVEGILLNLKGEVLTLIDASISERQQNKSVKDLTHKFFSSAKWDLRNIAANEDEVYADYGLENVDFSAFEENKA